MKLETKQSLWIMLGVLVVTGLIAIMVYQTGLVGDPPSQNAASIENISVAEPTNTSEPDTGWWDEKPTPISLD